MEYIMKKQLFFCIALPLMLSSCSGGKIPYSQHNVDDGIKDAIADCKEKVDSVNIAMSGLSFKSNSSSDASSRNLKKNAPTKGVDYFDISRTEFTLKQNFGLYIMNNVYHAVNYGYDSEGVDKGILIYDEVQNELDERLRLALKETNSYSNFYMQLDQHENGYHFDVDWLDDNGYRGGIYVSGNMNYENGVLVSYEVNCLTEEDNGTAYSSYFDFTGNTFYYLTASSNKKGVKGLRKFINDFNNGKAKDDNIQKYDFKYIAIASGKITDNPDELNFRGFDIRECDLPDDAKPFYTAIADRVSSLKFRSSNASLSYEDATRVHFMDAALEYGLVNTKLYYVTADGDPYEWNAKGEWRPVNIIYDYNLITAFVKGCGKLYDKKAPFFNKVKDVLLENNVTYLSEGFENDDFSLEMVKKGETSFRFNSYILTDLYFVLKDKINNKEYDLHIRANDFCIPNEHKVTDRTVLKTDFYDSETTDKYRRDIYINYARCDECGELVVISRTEKWYINQYYFDSNNIDEFYILESTVVYDYDYTLGAFIEEPDCHTYYVSNTNYNNGFASKHGDIVEASRLNNGEKKLGTVSVNYKDEPYRFAARVEANYTDGSDNSFSFETAVDVTKVQNENIYDIYFVRNYHSRDGDFKTKQQFTYEIISGSDGPVLTKYKIEVDVPQSLKDYYQENDIEKYKKLYQECIYSYDFGNNTVTTSTHNYIDKDGDPVVDNVPYGEMIVVPLYFDLGYNVNDYGNYDAYSKHVYLNLIDNMIHNTIEDRSAQIDPIVI